MEINESSTDANKSSCETDVANENVGFFDDIGGQALLQLFLLTTLFSIFFFMTPKTGMAFFSAMVLGPIGLWGIYGLIKGVTLFSPGYRIILVKGWPARLLGIFYAALGFGIYFVLWVVLPPNTLPF